MLLVLWIVAIVAGTAVGTAKGHGLAGFLLSFFLAWFGVIIVVFLPRRRPPQNITNINNVVNNPGYVPGLKDGE
jgi:hypothetical protein